MMADARKLNNGRWERPADNRANPIVVQPEEKYALMPVNDQIMALISARPNQHSAKITRHKDGDGYTMMMSIGGYTLKADFWGEFPKLDKNTRAFVIFLLLNFAAHRPNVSDKTIIFTVLDYIKYLGKEETQATIYETNKLISKCMSKLKAFYLPFRANAGDRPFEIPIGSGGALPGGKFGFKLSEDFYANLCESPLMQMSLEAIRVLDGKDDGPLTLYVRLLSHKNMNISKPNEDVISVSKMLDWSSNIPDANELSTKKLANRNLYKETGRRLIANLERLKEKDLIKGYCFCRDGGGKHPLSDKEANAIKTYADIIELFIKIEWTDYPKRKRRKTAANATTKTPGFTRTEVTDILTQDSPTDQEEQGD